MSKIDQCEYCGACRIARPSGEWQFNCECYDAEKRPGKSEPIKVLKHKYCKMHDAVDNCGARAKQESKPEPGDFTKRLINLRNCALYDFILEDKQLLDDVRDLINSLQEQLKEKEKDFAHEVDMGSQAHVMYVKYKEQLAAQDKEIDRLNELVFAYESVQAPVNPLIEKVRRLEEIVKELLLANPECCWRKCWDCGEKQIHREAITPGVLCRFCGSQDTRLLKNETEALKGGE